MNRPTISQFMTPSPHTIGKDQPLSVAHRFMREHGVRHLPVLENGKLVGLVTQRDLLLIETLQGVDVDTVRVEEAMTADPYVAPPSRHLDQVIRQMRKHKYGSTVVMEGEHVVGVFTMIDALDALECLLSGRPPRAKQRFLEGTRPFSG